MASFTPRKKTANDFNEGYLYEDGVDIVHADTINNLIESALWTQALATNQPNNDNANKSGLPTVSIEVQEDGTSRLKFENLAGITISNVRFELSSQTTTTAFYKFIATLSNGEEVEQDNAIQVPKTQVEISNLDEIFPVGITISLFNDTKPAEIWGGTWEELSEGTFIMSAGNGNEAGQTGGSKNVTLTKDNLPALNNYLADTTRGQQGGLGVEKYFPSDILVQTSTGRGWDVVYGNEVYPVSITIGSNTPFEILPPYNTAHIWRRVA